MDYSVKSGDPTTQRSACLLLPVFTSGSLPSPSAELDQLSGGYLSKAVKRANFSASVGQTLLLFDVPNAAAERVLLVGCGDSQPLSPRDFRRAAADAAKALKKSGAADALSCLALLEVAERDQHWQLRQLVAAQEAERYRFDQMKGKAKPNGAKQAAKAKKSPLRKLSLAVAGSAQVNAAQTAVRQAQAIASGERLAKDLGNLPSNVCTPSYLAEQAKKLGTKHKQIKVKVLSKSEMKKLGMNTLLSVAQGSHEPPKFIIMEYSGGGAKQKPILLIGKGITFDTGGISIKPAAGMDEMKYDMCGAASVIGTMQALAELNLKLNVTVLVPAVENMPGGSATNPGDVVQSLSGQTVEILNTDAEGRLILCDALTYGERYKPDTVIDVATLTGACVVALGKHPHGLFSNHQPLADALLAAGVRAHDRAWQMPLWEDYQEQLDSNFADMANVGGREAGAVTAACFLARFAENYHWAHLDIAGTAWLSGKAKGATGRPVPLLTQYLLDRVSA